VDRAGDVLDLRFEPRERRGLRLFVAAVWQAVTLADTVDGNNASGAGGEELAATWNRSEETS